MSKTTAMKWAAMIGAISLAGLRFASKDVAGGLSILLPALTSAGILSPTSPY